MNHVSPASIRRLGSYILKRTLVTRLKKVRHQVLSQDIPPNPGIPHTQGSESTSHRNLVGPSLNPTGEVCCRPVLSLSLPVPPSDPTTQNFDFRAKPLSRDDLLHILVNLLERKPPEALTRLVAYHRRFPELQSTRTFDLLLEHAIRHHDRRHIFILFRQLKSSNCSPSTITLRLWIRFLVDEGHVHRAWSSLVNSNPKSLLDTISIDVWKEFLRMQRVSNPVYHRKRTGADQVDPISDPLFLQFVRSALQREPTTINNLHFVRLLIARLVKMGLISCAESITRRVLEYAPLEITTKSPKLLLTIVHQFLAFGPVNTPSHFEMRRLLERLLESRPTLGYNADTLHLLLRSLSRTKNPGWQGFKLLKAWLGRWGPASEDNLVRLRIATFALRDGRDDIAFVMYERSKQKTRLSGFSGAHSLTMDRKSMREVYRHEGKQWLLWKDISKRCSQAQKSQVGRTGRYSYTVTQKSIRRLLRALDNASASWSENV